MSDVLSPVEQARAARWAADWLEASANGSTYNARCKLRQHADEVNPETVESLRAERDAARMRITALDETVGVIGYDLDEARAERDEARKQEESFRRSWLKACANLDAMRDERDEALRDNERFRGEQEELVQTLDKLGAANAEIYCLRAAIPTAESAWGRCQRED